MQLNLSQAYLMDGTDILPQSIQNIAEDINYKYPNLKLIWIPISQRTAEDTDYYAIVDTNTGHVIKPFNDLTINSAMQWLWENDSQRVDTYQKFLDEKAAHEKIVRDAAAAKDEAKLDIAASALGSKLHTYKHDGVTYSDSGVVRNAG